MEIDVMKIDPSVIEFTRVLINGFTAKQKKVLEEYDSKIQHLSDDWIDDSGFGEMSKAISLFVKNAIKELDQIDEIYGKYFFHKALDIRTNLAAIGRK